MKANTQKTSKTAGLRVKTAIKGGRISLNHNQRAGLRVKTAIKGGRIALNHNQRLV